MSDVRDLYQKILLDHYKNPRNSRRPHRVTHSCEGYNPLCGDRIIVYLTVEGGIVADAAFEASACAVCTASASVMTEVVKGEPTDRLQAVFDTFRAIVRGETISAAAAAPGDLAQLRVERRRNSKHEPPGECGHVRIVL